MRQHSCAIGSCGESRGCYAAFLGVNHVCTVEVMSTSGNISSVVCYPWFFFLCVYVWGGGGWGGGRVWRAGVAG